MRSTKKRQGLIGLAAVSATTTLFAVGGVSPAIGQYSPPEKCDPPGQPGTVCPLSPEEADRAYLTIGASKSKPNRTGMVRLTVKVDTRWDSATARDVRLKVTFPHGTVIKANRKANRTKTSMVVNLGTLSNVRIWKNTVFHVRASASESIRVGLSASASNAPKTVNRTVVLSR